MLEGALCLGEAALARAHIVILGEDLTGGGPNKTGTHMSNKDRHMHT